MKKILALLLAVMMLLPFAVTAVSAMESEPAPTQKIIIQNVEPETNYYVIRVGELQITTDSVTGIKTIVPVIKKDSDLLALLKTAKIGETTDPMLIIDETLEGDYATIKRADGVSEEDVFNWIADAYLDEDTQGDFDKVYTKTSAEDN